MPAEYLDAKYPLRTLYLYLTQGCNLRCRHCWVQPNYQTETHRYPALDFHLFKSIVEQAKPLGLTSIKLTGGEPLLHPKIAEILDFVRATDIRVVVETNGTLCTPEITRQIAACRDPFVSVSLDGADAETHEWIRGVNGCFAAALEAIRNLAQAALKPQVIMSLVRRNKGQIESIVRLAESLGAASVKFNIVQPTARALGLQKQGHTLDIEELVELGEWVERDLCARTPLRLHYSHPLVFRPLGRMFREDGGCAGCAILSILGVLADGSYAMCGIGETVPELVYGHAAEDRLQDIWTDSPVLAELREGFPHTLQGICAKCMFRDLCGGFCVAQNYQHSGSLWGSYWYCDTVWRKGLFPAARIRPQSPGQAFLGGQSTGIGYLEPFR